MPWSQSTGCQLFICHLGKVTQSLSYQQRLTPAMSHQPMQGWPHALQSVPLVLAHPNPFFPL
jgi:hypothetical protein